MNITLCMYRKMVNAKFAVAIHQTEIGKMAVFNTLADEIHCADIFWVGANNYDDPNKQLMTFIVVNIYDKN